MTTTEFGGNGRTRGLATGMTWQVRAARPDLIEATSAIVEELQTEYLGVLPASVIEQCVGRALTDLSGSICVEALPEMAFRLSRFRLDARRA